MVECLECHKQFEDETTLHKHLRAHKISVGNYHQKFYPRYDKYDGSLIKFKTLDQYRSNEFNSKTNLNKWLESVSVEERQKYITDFLSQRKQKKNLKYSLTQAELKTLMCPGMKYINDLFVGGYYQICDSLGFVNRFGRYKLEKDDFIDISKKVIFRDTREQKGLDFDLQTRNKCMDVGDYRLANCDIRVERKSIPDIWGSLSGGYDRFKREIDRAVEQDLYLIVLIESPLSELYQFPFRRQVYGKIKMSPEMPLHNMREILKDYKNVQFVFVKDREDASRVIEKIFSAGDNCRNVDLQYLVDIGGF